VHPNYADKHEPEHKPRVNGGPTIKTHVEGRYATDAESMARFLVAAAEVEVPVQHFVTRSDLACGTTIGPIAAAELGIRTVDVGNPMLSMHSIREQAGVRDVALMARVMKQVLERRS
jgi:aspartyl aminopeptidase